MKVTDKQIAEAFFSTGGNMGETIKALEAQGITITRQAIYKRMDYNEGLRQAKDDAEDSLLDMAESNIAAAIRNGDLKVSMEYLKTKGKSRGYGNGYPRKKWNKRGGILGDLLDDSLASADIMEEGYYPGKE